MEPSDNQDQNIRELGSSEEGRSPLDLLRMVAMHMGSIRMGLILAAVLVVLAFVNFVLFLLYEDSEVLMWMILVTWSVTWAFGLIGIVYLRDLFRATNAFRDWNARYRQFALLTSFEFLSPINTRLEQDVVDRLLTAYPNLEEAQKRRRVSILMPGRIRGKDKEHTYDITIETKDRRLWLVSIQLGDQPDMTSEDLARYEDGVRDICRRRKYERIEMILVSESDFSNEAIQMARNAKRWQDFKKIGIYEVLVRKIDTGFSLVTASDN